MKHIRFVLVLFVLLPLFAAQAADWQYAGSVNDAYSFFDTESIQHPDKDTVRVWTKHISKKTLKEYYGRKQDIDKTAAKLATGYSPAFFSLDSVKHAFHSDSEMQDAIIDTISAEVTANEFGVHVIRTDLFEIDCKGKRYALLSNITYKKDGSIAKTMNTQQPRYMYINPDSTGEWLSMLVCPRK